MKFLTNFVKLILINGHYKLLIYFSLIIIVLYMRDNFISFSSSDFYSSHFFISCLCLCCAFLLQAYSIQKFYESFGHHLSFKLTFFSNGLTVLTKYIPGNFWIVLGRSGFISDNAKISLSSCLQINIVSLIVMINVGSLLSIPILFTKDIDSYLFYSSIFVFVFSSSLLIQNKAVELLNSILENLGFITIPILSFRKLLFPFFVTILMYFFILLHFYFLVDGLLNDYNPLVILLFPLSFILSLCIFIVPGSLGVREGILNFLMLKEGVDSDISFKIVILSRLVFLFVEIFYFLATFSTYNFFKESILSENK